VIKVVDVPCQPSLQQTRPARPGDLSPGRPRLGTASQIDARAPVADDTSRGAEWAIEPAVAA